MAGGGEPLERLLRARRGAPAAGVGVREELDVALREARAPLGQAVAHAPCLDAGRFEHEPRDAQRRLPLVIDMLDRVVRESDAESLLEGLVERPACERVVRQSERPVDVEQDEQAHAA